MIKKRLRIAFLSSSETGFYYCGSRYYDPITSRWLNADAYVSTGQGILGNNMFVYCANDALKLQRYLSAEDNNLACLNSGTYIIPEEKPGPNRTLRPSCHTELNIPLVRPLSLIKEGEIYE